MATRQLRQVQNDWSAGSVRNVAADLIPENGALALEDLLVNIDGTAYERGGTSFISNTDEFPHVALWSGQLGPTAYTFYACTEHFGKLGADGATPVGLGGSGLQRATSLAVYEGNLYIGGGKRFAGDGLTDLPTDFWSWSYAVCQNRLFWLQGDKLRFTEINNVFSHTNRLGTDNIHTLADEGTGLVAVGPNLLTFTREGTWVWSNLALDIADATGTPLHRSQLYSRDLILWDQAGIAPWETMAVVPATNGIFLVDGISSPVRLSTSIDPLYQSYVQGPYHTGQAAVYNNHYFLPIMDGTTVLDLLVCRLDRASLDRRRRTTFPWSTFNGPGSEIGAFAVRIGGDPNRTPALLGGEARSIFSRISDCTPYFNKQGVYKNDGNGTPVTSRITTRDFILNSLGEAVPRKLRVTHELLDAAADNPVLALDYSDGVPRTTSPRWGDPAGRWGTGFGPATNTGATLWPWTDTDSQFWTAVTTGGSEVHASENDGRVPFPFRGLGGRTRKRRFRLRRINAAARFVLHDLELFSRPSSGVRRAR